MDRVHGHHGPMAPSNSVRGPETVRVGGKALAEQQLGHRDRSGIGLHSNRCRPRPDARKVSDQPVHVALGTGVDWRQADLTDSEAAVDALKGADVVFHPSPDQRPLNRPGVPEVLHGPGGAGGTRTHDPGFMRSVAGHPCASPANPGPL